MCESSTSCSQAVTFSQYSELAFVPRDDFDTKWISSQDKRQFQQTLIRDIKRMSKEMEGMGDSPSSPEDHRQRLYRCVGIEVFLTKGLARHTEERKRSHVQAVLMEQERQRQQGISDVEKLSNVSRSTSRWTKERAHALARGYSKLTEE